jgi:hypothetical protein
MTNKGNILKSGIITGFALLLMIFIRVTASERQLEIGDGVSPGRVTDAGGYRHDLAGDAGIAIYPGNPFYWQYKNEPVLLLGGSVDDNLFQIENLEEHLDLLVSVGGNYVRSTMSARDPGNVKPFVMKNGLFDLDEPNPEYWERFEELLSLSAERDIIVQVEIWATYDFYWGDYGWAQNPFNPRLNSSYTEKESSLPGVVDYPAQSANNPFFNSIPTLDNYPVVLEYQEKFVDRLLSISLQYHNVLYCIDNETKAHPEWGKHWSAWIRDKASVSGKTILVTEMWDNFDPSNGIVKGAHSQHTSLGGWYAQYMNNELSKRSGSKNTINDPESYQFIDISNHNAQRGEVHYQTGLFVRNYIGYAGMIRPINNVKIYGGMMFPGMEGMYWTALHKDGEERFWRNIFAGHASVRFHRPDYGLGLNHVAQHHIKSMRMLTDSMDFFRHEPSTHLLSEREENEAFCLAIPGREYALYFPGKGEVLINAEPGEYEIRWLQIRSSHWGGENIMELPGRLRTPSDDQWAVLIRKWQ